jgi:hypothetical protein
MEEVDGKTQAELAIKLSDNVRELVRQHLKAALEDPSFMGSLSAFNISEAAQRHLSPGNINFQNAVKSVIINQMNKY